MHAPVRILLQPMLLGLIEPNRCNDDQLAALGHRTACFERALTQEIVLVRVEAALEAEQQPMVARRGAYTAIHSGKFMDRSARPWSLGTDDAELQGLDRFLWR